jgi:hypothetical protein
MNKKINSIDLALSIYQVIKRHSIDNPITSRAIEDNFGLCGSDVRRTVKALRRSGEPIVSCSRGYYFDNSYSGVQAVATDLKRRAYSMLKTANDLQKKYGIEQETVFEGADK